MAGAPVKNLIMSNRLLSEKLPELLLSLDMQKWSDLL